MTDKFSPTAEPWQLSARTLETDYPFGIMGEVVAGTNTKIARQVELVCAVYHGPHDESNARLLLAAPRMLRFIRHLYGDLGLGGDFRREDMDEARAILRELEGGGQ